MALTLVPQWFFGFDIIMQLLFSLATAFVAFYSLKLYKISEQREIRLFCTAFILIAFSYLIKALTNWFVITQIQDRVRSLTLNNVNLIGLLGIHAYLILFTAGLATLAYLTFKIKSPRAYILLLAINIVFIILSQNKAFAFSTLSSLFILFICINYLIEFKLNKNPRTILIFLAFLGLFISGLDFFFISDFYTNYVISHFIELASYALILTSLYLTARKTKK